MMRENIQYTIPARLNESVRLYGEREAYSIVGGESFNYKDVGERVLSVIAYLEKLDVKPGDRVAILSTNMPNWGISYFAITSMGAIAVPLLPDFSPTELGNILEHSESKVILVSEALSPKLKAVSNDFLQSRILINDFSLINADINDVSYQENNKPKGIYNVVEQDLAAIIYTSGTTGTSKGVMLTHKNLIFDAVVTNKLQPVTMEDRFLSVLPLSHTYENTLGLILPMTRGASVSYLMKPPVPSILLPALKQVKPTMMLTVPLIIEKIYKKSILPKFNSSSVIKFLYKIPVIRKKLNRIAGKKLYETFGGNLHFFGIGGAKLDGTVEKFLKEAKFPYSIGYGLTETSPLVAGSNPKSAKLQAVGLALVDVEMIIDNPDKKTGEGEVWVRGANVMKGYYKDPEKTKEVLTEDGWFKTGDLATINKDGVLYIKGRLKNMIVGASGENIYPEDIESVINNFRYVVESLVVQKKGKLVALVHFNKEELDLQYNHLKEDVTRYVDVKLDELAIELQQYVNSRVNRFSRVELVITHENPFQKTATHKIKRFLYV
ncbi:MAG: AMP-binding protein [Bacteroidota bacterium]|nr:AMP-binding protein [Bacteroidota bacterium]